MAIPPEPAGLSRTGIVADTVLLAVSITETVLPLFVHIGVPAVGRKGDPHRVVTYRHRGHHNLCGRVVPVWEMLQEYPGLSAG